MKKIFLILIAALFSTQAQALDFSVGLSYSHRHFSENDQLGATSPTKKLSLSHSSGIQLSGSAVWRFWRDYGAGLEVSVGHHFVTAPRQAEYYTKTAGKIDTNDLTAQTVSAAAKVQVFERGGVYRLFVKSGFLTSILSADSGKRVDVDTGGLAGIELCGNLGKSVGFFVDVQTILSPSVVGPNQFVLSPNILLGLQWLSADEPHSEVQRSVSQEPKPVALENVAQSPVELPKPATAVNVLVTSPKDAVLPAESQKSSPEPQKIKATLRLGADGRLDPESYPFIQKVLDAHSQRPSTIKIHYRKDSSAQQLAAEIASFIVDKGCPKSDIEISQTDKLDKPIKINVIPK